MTKIAGIDLSYTSPAITVYDFETDRYDHYFYTTNKKLVSNGQFHCTLQPLWTTQEERFDNLSEWAIGVVDGCSKVWIEGYAFAAKGLVFQIGENTGLLKHKLWKLGIPFETFAPAAIKKIATGKGTANKEKMEEAWNDQVGLDIRKLIGQDVKNPKKPPMNPSSDIIDSYFIAKMGALLPL